MSYLLYNTIEKKKMKKFVKSLERKSLVSVDYGEVKHIALTEGEEVLNVFVYNERVMIEDSELKNTLNNLDEIFELRSNVNLNVNLVYNKEAFENHLKDLFLLN